MIDGLSEIKANLESLFSLVEREIVGQRKEIAALTQRVRLLEGQKSVPVVEQTPLEQTPLEQKPLEQRARVDSFSFDSDEASMFEVIDVKVRDSRKSIIGDVFSLSSTVGDSVKKSSPAWMTDRPGNGVDNLADAISLNDRAMFVRELFDHDSEQFALTVERLDGIESLAEGVNYLRAAFPAWDEGSDGVYRFYMILRRKFRG